MLLKTPRARSAWIECYNSLDGKCLHLPESLSPVTLKACGVCHSDLHVLKGELPFSSPCVLGHEITGEVVEHGAHTDVGITKRARKTYVRLSLPIIEQKEHFTMVKPGYFCEIAFFLYFLTVFSLISNSCSKRNYLFPESFQQHASAHIENTSSQWLSRCLLSNFRKTERNERNDELEGRNTLDFSLAVFPRVSSPSPVFSVFPWAACCFRFLLAVTVPVATLSLDFTSPGCFPVKCCPISCAGSSGPLLVGLPVAAG
ncbi:putative mannitol dehydrogenase [Dendrobium catenatum]|uniref:Putative mannitol dehydrogenase n=1 Tax=Dendrobium catenatum TaxID=906689 RepID=A0A2I0WM16_9ASPA|nr:putative mannitol dehydrogenase [Dendrobium catenatum]